ncbi:hypothetical protein O181_098071, partial [Austropuccinia psidii MF-1]|nr:hypothetical protein [Austropuccinia psidii MF-1]
MWHSVHSTRYFPVAQRRKSVAVPVSDDNKILTTPMTSTAEQRLALSASSTDDRKLTRNNQCIL